jgi:hypothetical protein
MSDLRISIGAFFTLVGLMVTATGVLSGTRAPLDATNVNLYSGVSMLAFGCVMLWLARRARSSGRP